MSSESAKKKHKCRGNDAASSLNGQRDGEGNGTAGELLAEMRAVLGKNLAHMTRMQHEMDSMKKETESIMRRLSNAPELESRCRRSEEDVLNIVQHRQRGGRWPLKSRRAGTFAMDPELNRLRLFSSSSVKHDHALIEKTAENKSGVKSCVLCISGKAAKYVRFHCSLCSVPLCRKKWPGFDLSCYEAWHTVADLGEERTRRKAAMEREAAVTAARRSSKGGQEDDVGDEREGEEGTLEPHVKKEEGDGGDESAGEAN